MLFFVRRLSYTIGHLELRGIHIAHLYEDLRVAVKHHQTWHKQLNGKRKQGEDEAISFFLRENFVVE